jgi:hypothetical protein
LIENPASDFTYSQWNGGIAKPNLIRTIEAQCPVWFLLVAILRMRRDPVVHDRRFSQGVRP